MPRYFTLEETAAMLHKSKSSLYKMTSNRTIPFVKLGNHVLFEPEALEAWLAAHRVPVAKVGGR